jgi:hypothetical protein
VRFNKFIKSLRNHQALPRSQCSYFAPCRESILEMEHLSLVRVLTKYNGVLEANVDEIWQLVKVWCPSLWIFSIQGTPCSFHVLVITSCPAFISILSARSLTLIIVFLSKYPDLLSSTISADRPLRKSCKGVEYVGVNVFFTICEGER